MTDREFLMWIHERLVHEHKEREMVDYMHRLRVIIMNLPGKQVSTNFTGADTTEELTQYLNEHSKDEEVKGFFKRLRNCLKGENNG